VLVVLADREHPGPGHGPAGRGGVPGRIPPAVLHSGDVAARRKAAAKTISVISPPALKAVYLIDAVFDIERAIHGRHGAVLYGNRYLRHFSALAGC
jgi:hypothetical protein